LILSSDAIAARSPENYRMSAVAAPIIFTKDRRLLPVQVPPTVDRDRWMPCRTGAASVAKIERLLVERDATLVAHYYTAPELQELAEATGGYVSDSLDMARFGAECQSQHLWWWRACGSWAKPPRSSIRRSGS
jgi:hypothetical protein